MIESDVRCPSQSIYHMVETVSTRVKCPIRSDESSGVQNTYMYHAKTINYSIPLFIMSTNTNCHM